jgi:hypothetical protein
MVVDYKGGLGTADTSATPSKALWAGCDSLELIRTGGIFYHEDFAVQALITSPTTIAALVGVPGLNGFSSDASQVVISDVEGGCIQIKQTTDDHATSIFTPSHPYVISAGKGKFWMEARIKCNLLDTTEQSMFLGLMGVTAPTVAIPLTTSAGAIADINCVGWHRLDTDLTSLKQSYKADGVTAVEKTLTTAIVADTWIKLGMKFDPTDDYEGPNRLSFWINGVRQTYDSTTGAKSKEIPDATGTDFPADVVLGPILALAIGAGGSDNTITMDWWRIAQVR